MSAPLRPARSRGDGRLRAVETIQAPVARTRARTGARRLEAKPPAPRERGGGRTSWLPWPRRKGVVGRRTPTFVFLLGLIGVLNLIGLVFVLSASAVTALYQYGSSWYHFKRQVLWVLIGALTMVTVMRTDYHRWRAHTNLALIAAGGLMVAVLVPGLGVDVNGSSRWLGYSFVRIQPAEFAKLAVMLFVADLLARRADKVGNWRATLLPVLVVFGTFALLLMLQPNLGTTIILGCVVFFMLFVSGVSTKPLIGTFIAGGVLAILSATLKSYRRRRLLGFIDPWKDVANSGYQTIQAQVAIAHGGVVGSGLGQSRAKYGFLPFAHTDFIYAIIADETGMIGALLVVALFVSLGVAGIRTALRAPDRYGMLLATGVTGWLLIQAFVNIGAVVGVLPITGVPLPFVSFGGSSLVVTMAAMGLVLNVARQAR